MQLAKRILQLALPSIATFSSMTFTGLLILMIVGKLGAGAIAVVGITNILMYNMWALCSGIQNAINYLVAQNYGSGEMRLANQRMQIALILTSVLAVLLLAGSLLAPDLILRAMGLNDEIVSLGTTYLMIRMIAMIFSIFSGPFFAYLRAIGDTRTPMTMALINSGLVVVLTYVLAYGKYGFPEMGLQGAAWSVLIAELVQLAMCLWVYYVNLNATQLTRRMERIDRKQVKLMIFESAKLSTMEMSNSLGMLVFTICISRLGTVAIAANEIALNILSFGFMPSNGFGAAATIGTGQEIGRGRPDEAKRFGLMTVALGLLMMVLISLAMFVFALPIAKLYTTEEAVYMAVIPLIHLAAFLQLFTTSGIIFGGGLRGIGDTTYLSRVAFILNWIIFIPGTVLLTVVLDYGQVGAWIALCSNMVLGALANGLRYYKLDWSTARVKSGKPVSAAVVSH